MAVATQNAFSQPSALKITDLRIARLGGRLVGPAIIRLDTNQGISGYGEIQVGASPEYAFMLKSRILGENPCNVDRIFRKIKQFGHHGRQGAGVSAISLTGESTVCASTWPWCGKRWDTKCPWPSITSVTLAWNPASGWAGPWTRSAWPGTKT